MCFSNPLYRVDDLSLGTPYANRVRNKCNPLQGRFRPIVGSGGLNHFSYCELSKANCNACVVLVYQPIFVEPSAVEVTKNSESSTAQPACVWS